MHIIKVEKKTKLAEKIGYFTITTIDLQQLDLVTEQDMYIFIIFKEWNKERV